MGKLKVVAAELIGSAKFDKLDREITELLRDFVQLGQKLIEMRDSQEYRTAGYSTFEDYCKSKMGLSIRRAQEVVRTSLVYREVDANLGRDLSRPETEAQVRQLSPIANFNSEKRKVQKQDGTDTFVEQTVGIKNPAKVAEQWEKTVREFERRKAKAEKEGTKPPTLSGKFVRNMLPNELKVSPERGFHVNPCVRMGGRLSGLCDDLKDQGFLKDSRFKKLVVTDPPLLEAQVGILFAEIENAIDTLQQCKEVVEPYVPEPIADDEWE